jgi:hypothetical protein
VRRWAEDRPPCRAARAAAETSARLKPLTLEMPAGALRDLAWFM